MKSIKLNFWHGLIIAVIVGATGFMGECSSNNKVADDFKEVVNYEHTVKQYVTKDGTLVNYNSALKTQLSTLEAVNDSLADYIKSLEVKDPETVTIIDTRVHLDTVFIPFSKPVDSCTFYREFEVDSTHYHLSGTATENGITIDSLNIPNRIGVTTSHKKTGFLKKELVVTVTNSNPLVLVDGISSFTFVEEKKWWQKGWVKITAGVVIGGVIVHQIK